MSESIQFLSEQPPSGQMCLICRGLSEDSTDRWAKHTGSDGEGHPMHKLCLQNWRSSQLSKSLPIICPVCKIELNSRSFFTRIEVVCSLTSGIIVTATIALSILYPSMIKGIVAGGAGALMAHLMENE
ncbi:MAG: hypothetical protein K1000chlam3_01498 [Chlamydiae bacterium]|nr:hypothetical protein [Chlamydiota bacterium]